MSIVNHLSKLPKRVARAVLASQGYEPIAASAIRDLQTIQHLCRVMPAYAVDCVLDVGANDGQFRDLIRSHVGYHGQIISFEPVSSCVANLQRRALSDARWQIEAVALGAARERRALNVMASSDFSSFLQPSVASSARWQDANTVARIEEVQVERLDDLYPDLKRRHGWSRPLLKLDTQGFESEVLAGTTACLSEMAVIVCEMSVLPLYERQHSYRDLLDRFEASGFALGCLCPVAYDNSYRLLEFNATFVNTRLALSTPAAARVASDAGELCEPADEEA